MSNGSFGTNDPNRTCSEPLSSLKLGENKSQQCYIFQNLCRKSVNRQGILVLPIGSSLTGDYIQLFLLFHALILLKHRLSENKV